MFFRVLDNKISDYADYSYAVECFESDLCSRAEYEQTPNKFIVVEKQEEIEVTDYDLETGEPIGTHTEIVTTYELALNPNFEAEEAQKEAERIAMLYLTAADVERGIYKAKGMDFDDILSLVQTYPQEGLDVKALKIELKANHFYRGNPYVNAIGALLGFTKEQLNKFFEDGNYEHLINNDSNVTHNEEITDGTDVNNSEQVKEENPVVEDVTDVEDVINLEDKVDNE